MMRTGSNADQVLVCRDCGKTFIFTAAGQEFFAEQGFRERPKRCKACREQRQRQRGSAGVGQAASGRFHAICWSCQKQVEVPFKPAPGRPVYCRICYTTQKRNGRV